MLYCFKYEVVEEKGKYTGPGGSAVFSADNLRDALLKASEMIESLEEKNPSLRIKVRVIVEDAFFVGPPRAA